MNQEKIGKFIAECRKEKNMTQSDVAKSLGITDKSVSKWERGICLPDVSLFQNLCDLLDISLNELFAGEHLHEKEIEKKSEENIINIMNIENLKMKKYKFIIIAITVILLFLTIIASRFSMIKYGLLPDSNLSYSQKYIVNTSNIKGDVDINKFENISLDFEIGANKYGEAVFKNPNKAYQTFRKKYNKGIVAIKKEFHLFPLTKFNYKSYKQYGWQLSKGSDIEKEQARFISSFLDIYENSFN